MTLIDSGHASTDPAGGNGGLGGFVNGDPLFRPTWQRSLQELAASNIALMGNGKSSNGKYHAATAIATSAPPPTAAAQILLGSRTDFGSFRSGLRSNVRFGNKHTADITKGTAGTQSRFSYDAMDIEEIAQRHRNGMLERVFKDQREQTRQLLDSAVERQVEEDWKEERAWWRKELVGDRNLVDTTNNQAVGSYNIALDLNYPRTGGGSLRTGGVGGLLVADVVSRANDAARCDPNSMRNHLDIVKKMDPTSKSHEIIAEFEKLACNEASGGGYKNAWLLLGCMLPKMQNPISAAQGTLTHFCRQYQMIINNHLRSASLSGQEISASTYYGGSNMANSIAGYVKLISGSNASVWEILYYCLRCGDANAAKAVLSATPAGGKENFSEQPIISRVLDQLSVRQGSTLCMFDVGSPMITSQDQSIVLNLYEKAKNLESNNTHKLGVLALLCGQQLQSFSTVEDYLFGCLWLALMDKENPVRKIEAIGASIRKYGPSHFAADGSGEWGYVLPLIASQQFETALSYLAEAGGPTGLMQAVHLGIVFAQAKVNVVDLGNMPLSSRGSARRDVITALLFNYAMLFESQPLASLEYLLLIQSHEEKYYQIANLIHRSPQDQRTILVGVLDDFGNRKDAKLDDYLQEDEVSAILASAAELYKVHASDRSKALSSASLFMLGYRHSKVVQLLNEMLSPVDVSNEDKTFWTDQCERFYNSFLSKRSCVMDSIEREGKLGLIDTNRILIELRSFFSIYGQRKFEEAFGLVSRTGLLPLTQEDLDQKTSKFRDLDPVLKNEFPAVLTATVECICEMFRRLKSESRGLPPTVSERLNELHFLARYLFIFAGRINMPTVCKEDIARMKHNMIM